MLIALHESTHVPPIDTCISGIITLCEAVFPGRVRGYYLVGSFGYGEPVSSSDIDMEFVFKDVLLPGESERFQTFKAGCRALVSLHLDLTMMAEADFAQHDTVAIKLASRCVYGEDTRSQIPLPVMVVYLRRIATPVQMGLTMRFRGEQVRIPLDYPLPDDPFYGYVPARLRGTPNEIKLWVLHIGWLATFITALRGNLVIASKQHMLAAYREYIGDEWTAFIEAVYENGRNRWQYQIPEDQAEGELFRALCQKTLAFENHVAAVYLKYLQAELEDGDRELAQKRLQAFQFP